MVNEYFVEDMKRLGLWSEAFIDQLKAADGDISKLDNPNITQDIVATYKTAFQQDQFKLIDAAAARQRWIDQGQSLNLYNDQTSLKYLNDLYLHAWNSGLKTTYYLRNKAASSIEKSTVATVEPENITACGLTPGECESCQ